MDIAARMAIAEFFSAAARLRDLGVIRSDRYLGDIGEYLCKSLYALELANSSRQQGHDGLDADGRVQVKYHGSNKGTNLYLGNPDGYEKLLVVLGPSSSLRPMNRPEDFLVYQMSGMEVRLHRNAKKGTYSCGKAAFNREPDRSFNLAQVVGEGRWISGPRDEGSG